MHNCADMRFSVISFISIGVAVLSALIASPSDGATRSQSGRLILWAWERPENLQYIDPQQVEVAALIQTINLSGARTTVHARQQPLKVPSGTILTAVTRIEVDPRQRASLNSDQVERCASAIQQSAAQSETVQIDFDARVSDRDFYRKLLARVREEMPAEKKLSITSLASWALGDNWLNDIHIDEAVPMFFQMGVGSAEVVTLLDAGKQLQRPYRRAVGVSAMEPILANHVIAWARKNQPGTNLYVFNPHPWTAKSVNDAMLLRKRLRENVAHGFEHSF